MRLIDADELEIDEIDNVRCYSILQVDEAPTVQAVPIDVLEKIRAEIEAIDTVKVKLGDGMNIIKSPQKIKDEVLEIIDKYRESEEV